MVKSEKVLFEWMLDYDIDTTPKLRGFSRGPVNTDLHSDWEKLSVEWQILTQCCVIHWCGRVVDGTSEDLEADFDGEWDLLCQTGTR